jgi:probable F420-dependent oxidoreductase
MSGRVEGVLPFWLDRPDGEALSIALEVERAGLDTLWIGETATFDAVALATAIGDRTGLRLKMGPLAAGVRSPVAVALAVSSVASLTGSHVDVALGASSPIMVAGWHDREWGHAAPRMRGTVECLRRILPGGRTHYTGKHVRTHGFRLRRPCPETRIVIAAFGPSMTRVAARHADEVVLNLVPPSHVSAVRAVIDTEAAASGRTPPALAVWVPVALEPGGEARAQLAGQLAVYLTPPSYGDMFSRLGYEALVRRARDGARRTELARDIPFELLQRVCAIGSPEDVAAGISAYHEAGADVVGVVPSTAEDPAGRGVLSALAESFPQPTTETREELPR